MRAAWYDRQGPAREVLEVGELPDPWPGEGEVRVRVSVSGIHVGDLGKRQGWWGSTMTFPRVVPHGDGAGVIDAVGLGVDPSRIGERVWVYLAQSYRPFGTAAEYTVVPARHAVPLPAGVPYEQAAGLGIPGITAHRAIFGDGPVTGQRVLVTGALGAVGRAALAVARRGDAIVMATVRSPEQVEHALAAGAHHALDTAGGDMATRILDYTGGEPIDRVAELAFDANMATNLEVLRNGGVIATYATGAAEPTVPYWPLGFKNITVRFLSNDDFPEAANEAAAGELTSALVAGDLRYPIAARLPLAEIAQAHELAEHSSASGRIVLDI
ncbi:NADPH:quinone reductase [Micromonospora noduli]|uniref:NADPH:quinone reductase n=1 Tax=Micromonospora noduli TaxID=709876 RepID=UPI000DBF3F16|nr:NADPH:quinone reductase [Micromonospora noduli]RAO04774.1 NADPH:quinone reductase [Micromonospora noduli]RAO27512.1 NADPH:quinone reductase [Micromonospora noduli]